MNEEEVILELKKYVEYSDKLSLSILSQLKDHINKSCEDEHDFLKMTLYAAVIAFMVCHTARSLKETSDLE